MGFTFRKETVALASALENFEQDKEAAAQKGTAALEQFETNALDKTVQAPPLEVNAVSSSDNSSDDSGDTDGGDSEPDFDFDSDPFADDSGDNADGDDDKKKEEEEENTEQEEGTEEGGGDADADADSESEVKTESFRRIDPIPHDLSLRIESNVMESFSGAAMQAWGAFSFVVGTLASVGINYGPMVLASMFKVVLYTFARTFQLLTAMGEACVDRIERYQNSSKKQSERLAAVAKQLNDAIKVGSEIPPELKAEFQMVSVMGGGDGANSGTMGQVLKYQAEWTSKTYGTLLKGATTEFRQLNELAYNRYMSRNFDAMQYLNQDNASSIMKPMSGSRMTPPEGTTYYSLGVMPAGGLLVLCNLPQPSDNWNGIEKNYNAAGFEMVGLGVSREFTAMTPSELVRLLSEINGLIESNRKHQLFYEQLEKARSGVLTQVKSLFVQLVRAQTRISFKDSVALPLFLKSSIATKVYLVGAMDIQDHNARVIANALAFAEWNIKLFRRSSKSEVVPSNQQLD